MEIPNFEKLIASESEGNPKCSSFAEGMHSNPYFYKYYFKNYLLLPPPPLGLLGLLPVSFRSLGLQPVELALDPGLFSF